MNLAPQLDEQLRGMDKPPQLQLDSMQLDIASAFYAGKPEVAATAAALSRALGPSPTLPRRQPSPQSGQSSLMLWPPVMWCLAAAVKHPMPLPTLPPIKRLQVLRTTSGLATTLPLLEALPVAKLQWPSCRCVARCDRHPHCCSKNHQSRRRWYCCQHLQPLWARC
uniref:Uncharacterized protein n=1 Tax=Arundo donax TaxID=35708 RepID=A0A0A9CJQ9_ARUDO